MTARQTGELKPVTEMSFGNFTGELAAEAGRHHDARLGEQQCRITGARGAVNSLALDILSECAHLRLPLEA
jgi:hypothetical protein